MDCFVSKTAVAVWKQPKLYSLSVGTSAGLGLSEEKQGLPLSIMALLIRCRDILQFPLSAHSLKGSEGRATELRTKHRLMWHIARFTLLLNFYSEVKCWNIAHISAVFQAQRCSFCSYAWVKYLRKCLDQYLWSITNFDLG